MTNFKLKIASRRSKLAMVQTLWVKDQLERNIPNLEVSIEAMATQGDKILDVALACLLYTSPSPRDAHESRMPSSA